MIQYNQSVLICAQAQAKVMLVEKRHAFTLQKPF